MLLHFLRWCFHMNLKWFVYQSSSLYHVTLRKYVHITMVRVASPLKLTISEKVRNILFHKSATFTNNSIHSKGQDKMKLVAMRQARSLLYINYQCKTSRILLEIFLHASTHRSAEQLSVLCFRLLRTSNPLHIVRQSWNRRTWNM